MSDPQRPAFPVPAGFPGYGPPQAPPAYPPSPAWGGGAPPAYPSNGPGGAPWPPPWGPPAYPGSGPGPAGRAPSGLFPSRTSRPTFREPHPATASAVLTGGAAGALWMLLFGLVARDARSYCWWSIAAGLVAWACAGLLSRFGDRGIAVGVAITSSVGLAIAMLVVTLHWIGGRWLLW